MSGRWCVALLCALLQFNASVRKDKLLHRWTGRLFLIAGCICVGCLYFLRPTIGMGSGHRASL
jgi:hypothetical protein